MKAVQGLNTVLHCRKLDSVKAWKAFAATYRAELDANLKRKYHIVARPTMTLAMYIAPITSPSLDWISYLTLSNVTCTRIDLIQLVQLANLGVLTIGANVKAPDVGLDDNIVRTWARSAATSNAFGILRVLNCRSQTHLTGRVFDYLEEFPALSVFSLEASSIGPDIRGVSQKVGWRCSTGEALAEWLIKRGASIRDWDSVIHACFRAAGVSRKFGFAEEKVQVLDSLPVLHLSLGGMPPPALVDVASDDSLILFHRVLSHAAKSSRIQDPNPRSPPRKKRMIRASKRQCMEHLLLGLET